MGQGQRVVEPDAGSLKARLPVMSEHWKPLRLPSGLTVFHNRVQGGVALQPAPPVPQIAGGCLADEMGLGKTMCVIALALANRRPTSDSGVGVAVPAAVPIEQAGPQVQEAGIVAVARPNGGTLVVCPSALLQQWEHEIRTHTDGSVTVWTYLGLKSPLPWEEESKEDDPGAASKPAPSAGRPKGGKSKKGGIRVTTQMQREMEWFERRIQGEELPTEDLNERAASIAQWMASRNIVLTSFDVLRAEVNYSADNPDSKLNKAEKAVCGAGVPPAAAGLVAVGGG